MTSKKPKGAYSDQSYISPQEEKLLLQQLMKEYKENPDILAEIKKKKKTMKAAKGGMMKKKGAAKGGMMKKKGAAKGGMMKKKGYAKGGAMKKKGYAKGGAMKKKGYAMGGMMEERKVNPTTGMMMKKGGMIDMRRGGLFYGTGDKHRSNAASNSKPPSSKPKRHLPYGSYKSNSKRPFSTPAKTSKPRPRGK